MHMIKARNVNDAYRQAIQLFSPLVRTTAPKQTRYGDAWVLDGPVMTEYAYPTERVLWDSKRECHPFFHLFESLWMLAGRDDIAYLTQFVKRMASFSDDGVTQPGAYGQRWRYGAVNDQILTAVQMLRQDPTTRRCVITMWEANKDFGRVSKDIPCNLSIKLEISDDYGLDMTVFNRSNDMIWGAYGANAVHMSYLQEFVAGSLGIPVGRYWQISANFHTYAATWNEKVRDNDFVDYDLYDIKESPLFIRPVVMPLLHGCKVSHERARLEDIEDFCNDSSVRAFPFLQEVAGPLKDIWDLWRSGAKAKALIQSQYLPNQDNDWVMACRRWLEARSRK